MWAGLTALLITVLAMLDALSVGGGRLRRYLARHHLTDAERNNLREYYRRNHVQSPAIMTAALGGHPFTLGRPG
jgi:hypothetical protein